MRISSAHGGGGRVMDGLIREVFVRHFSNETLDRMEDAAVLGWDSRRLAFTTDSFVVTPLFFPGGDIGRLAVCGTVNDLLMRGAVPRYLTAGFILEEGLELGDLERVVASMAQAAREAGVLIVAGDTKVVEGRGGLYINTAGIGTVAPAVDVAAGNALPGDAVLVSGTLGDHHACILAARMGMALDIASDCAPLGDMVAALLGAGLDVHAMRDVTRGGLATVLHEIATASGVEITLNDNIPWASTQVQGFCEILGLDPLYMGNEGKFVALLPENQAQQALSLLHACAYGQHARIIGQVTAPGIPKTPRLLLQTPSGSQRILGPLAGEGLPRIC